MNITDTIGEIPYRMAFAGGWIDQPFVSKLNPTPPGSMVVVGLKPFMPFMDRAGMATGTRKVANRLWNGKLPNRSAAELVKELYREENKGKSEPSGSQDMIGLIYPGVSRLDYDASHEGGIFPIRIESCTDPEVGRWIERFIKMVPIAPRPEGYNPLGEKNLDVKWIQKLGQTGRDCYNALVRCDPKALGESMNTCMTCWETILPQTVRHPTIHIDLLGILRHYQRFGHGAMYSGCGGGYIYVVSEKSVPGGFSVQVRF